jgi:hypothetical protein
MNNFNCLGRQEKKIFQDPSRRLSDQFLSREHKKKLRKRLFIVNSVSFPATTEKKDEKRKSFDGKHMKRVIVCVLIIKCVVLRKKATEKRRIFPANGRTIDGTRMKNENERISTTT